MRTLLVVVLVALVSGCTGGSGSPPGGRNAVAEVSHGANGDCVRAWNAPGNSANRSAAAVKHDGWAVSLSEWVIDHRIPDPSGDDLVGEGCSYFLSSSTNWRSYSGGWEADGDLRWGSPPGRGGLRTAEQQIQPPNAILQPEGRLARLPLDRGGEVAGREWKAVIDDWYDNGEFDEAHRCAAVREAIAHVPAQGPNYHTATEDLLAYSEQVC
jgi:hypothetical protein